MRTNIKATKMDLSQAIKDYIEKKVDMLGKYLGDIPATHIDFEVGQTTNHHAKGEIYRAELNLNVPGELLRVEKTGTDIYEAIDKVKDHMDNVIKKYKEKKEGR